MGPQCSEWWQSLRTIFLVVQVSHSEEEQGSPSPATPKGRERRGKGLRAVFRRARGRELASSQVVQATVRVIRGTRPSGPASPFIDPFEHPIVKDQPRRLHGGAIRFSNNSQRHAKMAGLKSISEQFLRKSLVSILCPGTAQIRLCGRNSRSHQNSINSLSPGK